MAKRHKDAIGIQQGACNPIAIVGCLAEAIAEVRAEGGGTTAILSDPAVRLITHQLAWITGVNALDSLTEYDQAIATCAQGAQECTDHHTLSFGEGTKEDPDRCVRCNGLFLRDAETPFAFNTKGV